MKAIDKIKNILSGQIAGYNAFLDLLHREKACLININPVGVEGLSREKDTLVLRLKLLEEERIRLVGLFSAENKLPGDINLRKIAEFTKDADLQKLRLQLVSLMQGITELNEFNRALIERSISFVRNSVNFLELLGVGVTQKNSSGSTFSREV